MEDLGEKRAMYNPCLTLIVRRRFLMRLPPNSPRVNNSSSASAALYRTLAITFRHVVAADEQYSTKRWTQAKPCFIFNFFICACALYKIYIEILSFKSTLLKYHGKRSDLSQKHLHYYVHSLIARRDCKANIHTFSFFVLILNDWF